MNDETKAELMKRTREWLQSCVNAATRSGVPEEADLETFVLAHIDGEPARLAAAREEAIMEWRAGAADRDELRADCERRIAAAREEQREACAIDAEERVGCASTYDEIRSVPLDATPLADELRTLRAALERANEGVRYWTDLAQAEARDAAALRTWVSTVSEALGAIEPVSDCRVEMSAEASAKVAESLRARVAELEAQAERLAKMYARALGRESEAARAEQDEAAKK